MDQKQAAAARQKLAQKVGIPAFREKLARDWNINPRNEAELGQLLQLGHMLHTEELKETEKTASAGNPFLASAIEGLQAALGAEGVHVSDGRANAIKQAAFSLTQDNEVAHAALAYAEYLTATE